MPGQEVVKALGNAWEHYPTNSYCAIFKKEWLNICKSRGGIVSKIPFFHYEFNGVGTEQIRIGIHVERSEKDYREDFKKNLDLKSVLKNVNLSRSQVIYSEIPARKVSEDQLNQKGIKAMIDLIKKTEVVLDNAFKNLMA
jgi:hypothetical protein